ncbi:MAG: c-type cytochrome, partial [Planctomycetes bacterium]|nr:c-type cytochrome [Planctomycetota bacterium]
LMSANRDDAKTSLQRVGLLTAWRWLELDSPDSVSAEESDAWIGWGLADDSEDVALTAMRWATERGLVGYLEQIRALLDRPSLSPKMFAGIIASIAYLESGSAARGRRDPERERLLYEYAKEASHPAALRALAVNMLPSEAERPSSEELLQWVQSEQARPFGIEVVQWLAQRADRDALNTLAAIAGDDSIPLQTRADAAAGLSRNAGEYASVLNQLSLPRQPAPLREEAKRVLRRKWGQETNLPRKDDLDGWTDLVSEGGDVDAGRRVFFRSTCANCHAYGGRGASTGPDLSTLSGQMTPRRLMESILQPSKEIGPLYVPWRVITVDGHILTGLKLDAPGVGNSLRFQGADGMVFEVPLQDIEQQEPTDQSIMPTGLETTMSIEELRDLTAFLIREPS